MTLRVAACSQSVREKPMSQHEIIIILKCSISKKTTVDHTISQVWMCASKVLYLEYRKKKCWYKYLDRCLWRKLNKEVRKYCFFLNPETKFVPDLTLPPLVRLSINRSVSLLRLNSLFWCTWNIRCELVYWERNKDGQSFAAVLCRVTHSQWSFCWMRRLCCHFDFWTCFSSNLKQHTLSLGNSGFSSLPAHIFHIVPRPNKSVCWIMSTSILQHRFVFLLNPCKL